MASALLSAAAVVSAHDPIATPVTWNGDVARIVQARCVSCHRAGGRAPMPLTTYAEARPWAKAIKEEVMTRRMPKWHAARGYGDFANDPSLSPFEIALIRAWADGGAPLGEDLVAPASVEKRQETVDTAGRNTSVSTVPCRSGRVPSGLLTAVRPVLSKGGSIGLAVALPDGRTEVLAWIRNFDPDFAETYGLRRPLAMPRGSRLVVVAEGAGDDCSVMLTLVQPR
jgi:hypothetical protein